MISFESDYINGVHPEILKALADTNNEDVSGYGNDRFTESAREKIKKACGRDDAQVFFLVGGTQTNVTVIASVLNQFEGAVCAETGHINVHESGALEFNGVKALALPGHDGKVDAGEFKEYLESFHSNDTKEHMVFPGLLYISHPTEYGTLYTKSELTALHDICAEYGMTLFLDGARLGYGLMSYDTDVTLGDIANLTDVFYIGGTKVGALCGEAVVFTHGNAPAHFINLMKKRGALLAKGRVLGVQFDALFTDDLYFRIGRYAIDMAERLKKMFTDRGYRLFKNSPTNQQFVILDNTKVTELRKSVKFETWEKYDENNTVVRFVTSWSTRESDMEELEKLL